MDFSLTKVAEHFLHCAPEVLLSDFGGEKAIVGSGAESPNGGNDIEIGFW